MHAGLMAAQDAYRKHGKELAITSGNEGEHMEGSAHYDGYAVDLRTWHLEGKEVLIKNIIASSLNEQWKVVYEPHAKQGPHIHLEYIGPR